MYKIHIEIGQYQFIETECETIEETKDIHDNIKRLFNGEGLPVKDFNKALDRYLKDGTGDVEEYMKMSDNQKMVFQEIKKSLKRIDYEART